MKYEDIKFFSERCEEHPDHQSGMISNSMIQQRLHEEIDELRAYIESQLAQSEQEPVAWITPDGEGFRIRFSPPVNDVPLGWDALYTTPQQRKPLTDEEINQLWAESHEDGIAMQQGFTTQQHYFAYLILRKAQEK